MKIVMCVLLLFLLICAGAVSFSKKLLQSVLIYMSFSLIMSIVWILLESPDLAITEAAVGAGVTSLLFFVTLKKIHALSADQPTSEYMEDDGNTDNTAFAEEEADNEQT